MRIGIHLPIAKGLKKTTEQALSLGCNTLQVFAKNPRSWTAGKLDEEGAVYLREYGRAQGLSPVVVHVTYLINPCSPDPELYEKSVKALQEEVKRAEQFGADLFVMHPGNRKESPLTYAVARIQKAIDAALESATNLSVLVENTAGSGSEVGSSFQELAMIVNTFPIDKVGICFDTCHAFAGGHDLRTVSAWRSTMANLSDEIDLARLQLVHVNDAKGELGSHLDRHTHLGEGKIGATGFRAMVKEVRDLPFILETPGRPEKEGKKNMAFLRGLK